jgi:hypothetical protein
LRGERSARPRLDLLVHRTVLPVTVVTGLSGIIRRRGGRRNEDEYFSSIGGKIECAARTNARRER